MKLPDGVILDKTIADQVRLHHIIFVEKFVLAAIAWINGALPTQTHTILFRSCNKISHMMQETLSILHNLYIHSSLSNLSMNATLHTQREIKVI